MFLIVTNHFTSLENAGIWDVMRQENMAGLPGFGGVAVFFKIPLCLFNCLPRTAMASFDWVPLLSGAPIIRMEAAALVLAGVP